MQSIEFSVYFLSSPIFEFCGYVLVLYIHLTVKPTLCLIFTQF